MTTDADRAHAWALAHNLTLTPEQAANVRVPDPPPAPPPPARPLMAEVQQPVTGTDLDNLRALGWMVDYPVAEDLINRLKAGRDQGGARLEVAPFAPLAVADGVHIVDAPTGVLRIVLEDDQGHPTDVLYQPAAAEALIIRPAQE